MAQEGWNTNGTNDQNDDKRTQIHSTVHEVCLSKQWITTDRLMSHFFSSTVGNKRLTRHSTLTEIIITYTKPSVEDELLITLSQDGQSV